MDKFASCPSAPGTEYSRNTRHLHRWSPPTPLQTGAAWRCTELYWCCTELYWCCTVLCCTGAVLCCTELPDAVLCSPLQTAEDIHQICSVMPAAGIMRLHTSTHPLLLLHCCVQFCISLSAIRILNPHLPKHHFDNVGRWGKIRG